MNNFRPVALTCNIMKCFEKILLKNLLKQTITVIDPMQFAYRANRGVDDAVLLYLHKAMSHLDNAKTYVRSVFIDFSSAFNTDVPHLLIRRLKQLNVSSDLLLVIGDFL